MSVAGDSNILCMTNRAVGPGPDSNPEIFVVEMRANRNDPVRKMLLGGLVAINPCRRLGRERSRHANPKPRVGPLTSTRDRIGALVRTSVVLISPCGSGVLHRMGQRPPVLRHSQRIASIEPPLAERTPGKAIGIERSVSGCASSAIGHVRP
jgi:hypothetical protein